MFSWKTKKSDLTTLFIWYSLFFSKQKKKKKQKNHNQILIFKVKSIWNTQPIINEFFKKDIFFSGFSHRRIRSRIIYFVEKISFRYMFI